MTTPAVVLLGLLVIVVAEGSYQVWHTTDQARPTAATERDEAVGEIERRFEAQRFALAIDGIDATLHPTNNPIAGESSSASSWPTIQTSPSATRSRTSASAHSGAGNQPMMSRLSTSAA
jgi:hypothetical protein